MARRRQRVTAERIVQETLSLCCVDPSRVPREVVDTAIEMARHRGRDREAGPSFLLAARSVVKLLTRPRRLNAALDGIEAPVLLIHGAKDRLVPVRVARSVAKAHPDWQLEIADDIGHVPQLEAADWTATVIRDWLRANALLTA